MKEDFTVPLTYLSRSPSTPTFVCCMALLFQPQMMSI